MKLHEIIEKAVELTSDDASVCVTIEMWRHKTSGIAPTTFKIWQNKIDVFGHSTREWNTPEGALAEYELMVDSNNNTDNEEVKNIEVGEVKP